MILTYMFLFSFNFFHLDPDPHFECGSGSRRANECGSMRIRIHSPVLFMILLLFY